MGPSTEKLHPNLDFCTDGGDFCTFGGLSEEPMGVPKTTENSQKKGLPPLLNKITYAKKILRNYFRADCDTFA